MHRRAWPWAPRAALVVLLVVGACRGGPAESADDTDRAAQPATTVETDSCDPSRGHAPGAHERTIEVGGPSRSYLLYVPESYDGTDEVPVVWNFHGLGSTAPRQLVYSAWGQVADAEGFLVVTPQALGRPAAWAVAADGPDADFVDAAGDDLARGLCTDEARWYASGISNGSIVTTALACGPDRRFAAFGLVAGSFHTPACAEAAPAPIVAFHGTADRYVPYEGGLALGRIQVDPIDDILATWAAQNGCAEVADEAVSASVIRRRWSTCDADADVELYTIVGGGHTWPGGGVDPATVERAFGTMTTEITAAEIMWAFFATHES